MATFLDESSITGVRPPDATPGAPPPPKGATFLDESAITGVGATERSVAEDQSLSGRAKAVASDVAKYTAGSVGTFADMILGSPAMVGSFFTHVAGRTGAQLREPGLPAKEAAGAGQSYTEALIPEWAYSPLKAAVSKLSPEAAHYFENSPLGKVMGMIGKGLDTGGQAVEKTTGVPAADLKAGIDGLMGALGVKGGKASVEAIKAKIEAAAKKRAAAGEPGPDGSVAERIGGEPLDTKPPAPRSLEEVNREIADLSKEDKTVAGHLKAAAKDAKAAGKLPEGPLKDRLLERSALRAAEAKRLTDESAAAKQAAIEEQSRLRQEDLDSRIGGESAELSEGASAAESPGDAHRAALDVKAISEKPGALRTPEEMIRLRAALKAMRQGGFSDAKVAAGILAGTVTGAALWKLYQTWAYKGEVEDAQKALDEKYNKRQDDRQELRRRQDDYNRGLDNLDREPPVVPNPKNNPSDPNEVPIFTADTGFNGEALGAIIAAGGVMGAIKPKGGAWHLEAVERLAAPLKDKLFQSNYGIRLEDNAPSVKEQFTPVATKVDSMIKTYLNKHAGVEGDPLKDVELPSGKTWGETMDATITKQKVEGPKGPEDQYGLPKSYSSGPTPNASMYELSSQLAHVGDFLRQNVDPAKLAQYDLVRAVKETAANDARVAKEMERAAAASTKDMPVYKDYGDGMKWVELKLPEKLSEEQASRIRKSKSEYSYTRDETDTKTYDVHEALDAQGKPIVNSYTNEVAQGATPEEAHLAGQLAQEGNQMGHCVGGYCADVASGQTRILSLRDAKGRSHVTVEIGKPEFIEGEWMNEAAAKSTHPDILQIKGKQNRAPNAEYLPYVQDLVKGGKWGEVGDIQNAQLHDLHAYKSLANNYREGTAVNAQDGSVPLAEFEKLHKQRYITEDELNKLTVPQKQRGSADPRLLAGIAAAGGIAAYTASHPDEVQNLAALGMLALPVKGLKGFRESMASVAKGIDYALGATSTRLGNISPALRLRARDYERRVLESTEQSLDKVQPFLQVLQTAKEGSPLDLALLNGDGAKIATALKDQPAAQAAWKAVQGVLKSFEEVHREMGRFKEGVTNYFPRIVSDLEGLKKALGQEQRTSLEDALMKAEAKMIKEQQRSLTDVETSLIVNNSLHARPAGSQLPGFAHSRKIEEVTQALRPFYAAPTDSLLRYVSAAIQDAEMARFFGRDLASRKIGGKTLTDVDASIGNVVGQELKAGRMDHTQANELRELLKARFEGGEQTMAPGLQDLRNATNVALLGQFGSAATQIGDSVMTIYHHGLMPTLQALKQKLTGDSQVTGRQFGIVNHIAEELGSNRWTGKALQLVFKANGFAAIDQFAKGLNLNAGLVKNQRLAGTERGRAELAQKYAVAFGEEFPQLLQDLAAKQVTPRVKSLLFSELSDAQPLTKMEMPQAYLENPNGRLLYQMKTYMLKQMDVIRRDAFQEIAKGNYVRGAKNLVAVSAALALSNIPGDVIKDWISGRDVKLDKIDYVEALLRNFGVSRYSLDQVSSGKPLEVLRDMALPPYKHFQELLNAALPGAKPQDEAKAAKYVPLVGRAYYDRELGGNEARKAAELLRLKREARDAREAASPLLKDLRLRKQEAVRQRKLQRLRAAP